MNDKENVNHCLRSLGDLIGIDDLILDDGGICCLSFDDDIMVTIQFDEQERQIIFFTPLGEVKDENRMTVYEKMLSANLFWRETGGATLSFEKESDMAVLLDRFPIQGFDPLIFQDSIQDFVNMAETWTTWLMQLENDTDANHSLPPSLPGNHMIRG